MTYTASPAPRPRLSIRPSAGWAAVNLRELWQSRELLLTLAARDIKLRYKQTALGVAWVVLQPIMGAAIFTFLFAKVARFPAPGGAPYFIFAFTGLVAWNAFGSTLNRTTGSMVGNAHLVSKIYFPRLILPLSSLISTLIDFTVALAILLVLLMVGWKLPGPSILLMPLFLIVLLMIALGLGLCLTALAVTYRDVQYILPFFTQLLLLASPVAYWAADRVPREYHSIYYLNPLASLIEAFQWSVLGVGSVHWGYLIYSVIFAMLLVCLGAFAFKRMERNFADVI